MNRIILGKTYHCLVFFLISAVREESAYHPRCSLSLNAPWVLGHRDEVKACLSVSCNSKMRWRRDAITGSSCLKQNKERHKNLTSSSVTHHVHRALAALSGGLSHFWTYEMRGDVNPGTARMVHVHTIT